MSFKKISYRHELKRRKKKEKHQVDIDTCRGDVAPRNGLLVRVIVLYQFLYKI